MITVFMEPISKAWSEEVATFNDEAVYMLCLPALEAYAAERNCIITESVEA